MTEPLLQVQDLCVRYGTAQALFDLSFKLEENSALAVLGANGAGKSTLARALSGLVPVAEGSIRLDGREIANRAPSAVRRKGIVHMPEGRGVFRSLSVLDNLRMATAGDKRRREEALQQAFDIFPVLAQRRKQQAGTLSGGEQQMLSLARSLVVTPRLMIADELSLGLAPKLVDVVFESLVRCRASGVSVVLIEQFAKRALGFADSCLILQRGRTAWQGPTQEAGDELLRGYLGAGAAA
jgi:branched-chain amino acid transport system ATP-binding protein